jgi:ribonuclease HI
MLRRARKALTRVARLRWRTRKEQARTSDFEKEWGSVCDVRREGALVVHVLDDPPHTSHSSSAPVRSLYTDGSMRQQQRNANAGWAFVVVATTDALERNPTSQTPSQHAKLVEHAACGTVNCQPGETDYDGATKRTNNTAELTALLRAVQYETCQPPTTDTVEFCVDSTYAINAALGRWHSGRKNQELARRLRAAYAALCTARGHQRVRLRHVRSHTHDAANEAADCLAKHAAQEDLIGDGADVLRRAREAHDEHDAATTRPQDARDTHTVNFQPPATAPASPTVNIPVVARIV